MTADRIVETTWRHNGRHVTPGTELSVRGAKGRYTFVAHVTAGAGEWIDCYGGPDTRPAMRSFSLDRITVVHRTIKRRASDMPKPRPLGRIRPGGTR